MSRLRVLLVVVVALATVAATAVAHPPRAVADPGADGVVLALGSATFAGSTQGTPNASLVTGLAPTPSGDGYWLAAANGAVNAFGDATDLGSASSVPLRQPVVGIAAARHDPGYWLVAADGGVFAFGSSHFFGSVARLNQPIVGMAATPTGGGYWLVARDGGVFAFGDAHFYGSAASLRLVQPVVGMATTPSGRGYWLASADGGIFAFGDARFFGSAAGLRLSQPVAGMAATPSGNGYWLASADGGVFAFGDARFAGSGVGRLATGKQVLGIAPSPKDDAGYWLVAGRPQLALGAIGPGVAGVQQRLVDLGFWGPVDGTYGAVTVQQVYAFQKANNLPRDGRLDGAEVALLEQAIRPRPRSTSGYLLEIDKSRQLLIVARDGFAEWVFNTSTGNGRPYRSRGGRAVAITPEGRFSIYNQINGLRISDLGVLFRPKYFTGGYAVHGSPSIPPFPASHGCVRVSNAAINFIWDRNVLPLGTPVLVYS